MLLGEVPCNMWPSLECRQHCVGLCSTIGTVVLGCELEGGKIGE